MSLTRGFGKRACSFAKRLSALAGLGLGASMLGGCGVAIQGLATQHPDPRMGLLGALFGKVVEDEELARNTSRQVSSQATYSSGANVEPQLMAYSVDPARDGDATSVSGDDFTAPRSSLVFRDDEYVAFVGYLGRDHRFGGRFSSVHVFDGRQNEVVEHAGKDLRFKGLILLPSTEGYFFGYDPGDLSPGHYRAIWSVSGSFSRSLEFDVRDTK